VRFPLRIYRVARADKPSFIRFSATGWVEIPEKSKDRVWKQWGIEKTTMLVSELERPD
jgi:hypothetical protein